MKKLSIIFLVLIGVLLLWWLVERRQSTPSVHFAVATRKIIESIVSTNGRIEPVRYAVARAEIAGVVDSVSVERGDRVRNGQTLVTLDNQAQQSAVNTARAQLEQARAELGSVKRGGRLSQLTDLEGRLNAARLNLADAERRLEITKRLVSKQAATSEEQRQAQAVVDSARQQVSALEANRRDLVAPSDVTLAEARFKDAQAALELAQHRLSQTIIKAPMDGTVYQFDIKKGAYLEVGALVASVGDLDRMRVRVYVDEPDLGRVSLNLPVEITWTAHPGQKWHGTVAQLPTEISTLGTRQVGEVICLIDNPDHELLPGTNIDANIISQVVKDALSVPKQALQATARGSGVWKLVGSTVHWQPVTSGVSDITSVEIKQGLQPGDRVVLPSDAALDEGMHVEASPEVGG